jgi:hypothetical protein
MKYGTRFYEQKEMLMGIIVTINFFARALSLIVHIIEQFHGRRL